MGTIIWSGVHTSDATDRASLALKGGFNLIRTQNRNDTATHASMRKEVAIAKICGPRSSIRPIIYMCKSGDELVIYFVFWGEMQLQNCIQGDVNSRVIRKSRVIPLIVRLRNHSPTNQHPLVGNATRTAMRLFSAHFTQPRQYASQHH